MVTPLPFAQGFYESESLPLSAQRCINAYPHVPDGPALNSEALFGTPGIDQIATSGASVAQANRGAHKLAGVSYWVNSTSLIRLEADNSLTTIGTIEGTARVSMADNGSQLMILVPGGKGYIYTAATASLVEITDSDFRANGNPQYVVFIDGYFCCTTDENKHCVSALNDGTNWDALDFGSAESSPDGVVVPVVYKNQLFIGGEVTTEAFNNIGGSEYPFERAGLFLEQGVFAPYSVVNSEDSFMFIGGGENESPAVWAFSGGPTTQKVSTFAIDNLLGNLSQNELEAVYGWSYGANGHYFVGFTLPTTTVVFDVSTGRWHERQSRLDQGDGTFLDTAWRVSDMVTIAGQVYVGDTSDGRIGVLNPDSYQEYGDTIIRQHSTQPFQNNMQPFSVPKLELTIESGVGNSDETDPQVRLEISRDGGVTWGVERPRAMGKVGEYNRRAIWRRNGRTKRFDAYRFTMSDPVKYAALQLTAQLA